MCTEAVTGSLPLRQDTVKGEPFYGYKLLVSDAVIIHMRRVNNKNNKRSLASC